MLSRVDPRGHTTNDRGSKLVGAGRHHGAGERVRPIGGPHLLLLLLLLPLGLLEICKRPSLFPLPKNAAALCDGRCQFHSPVRHTALMVWFWAGTRCLLPLHPPSGREALASNRRLLAFVLQLINPLCPCTFTRSCRIACSALLSDWPNKIKSFFLPALLTADLYIIMHYYTLLVAVSDDACISYAANRVPHRPWATLLSA